MNSTSTIKIKSLSGINNVIYNLFLKRLNNNNSNGCLTKEEKKDVGNLIFTNSAAQSSQEYCRTKRALLMKDKTLLYISANKPKNRHLFLFAPSLTQQNFRVINILFLLHLQKLLLLCFQNNVNICFSTYIFWNNQPAVDEIKIDFSCWKIKLHKRMTLASRV